MIRQLKKMTENCNHYFVEKFDHGTYDKRWFKCIFCTDKPVLKADNKLMNFRESEPAKAWAKILKAST